MLASGIIKQSCLINFKCSVFVKADQNHRKHKEAGVEYRNVSLLESQLQRSPLNHGEAEFNKESTFCMKNLDIPAFIGDKYKSLFILGRV